MRYAEHVLSKHPLFLQIKQYGVDECAKMAGVSKDVIEGEVIKLTFAHDTELFAEKCLKIADKNGAIIPFIYNKAQKKLREAIERQKIAGQCVRICMLKARQWGGSTEIQGEIFKDSVLRTSRRSLTIAHDLSSAQHLRDMSARYYENMPIVMPKVRKESEKWWKYMHFVNKKRVESHYKIDTADELSTGHSETFQNLHLSEVQAWRNAATLIKGLFPTVPNSPDTMIFMEGTGSGVGDWWYEFCQNARHPDSIWAFVFVAWYEIEDYTLPFRSEEEKNDFKETLGTWSSKLYGIEDYEELAYIKDGVSYEQLHWRRVQIKDVYKGDFDSFHQQYPKDADQAFLTSGRSVFSMGRVTEGLQKSKPPKMVCSLERYKEKDVEKVRIVQSPRGYWDVWEEPQSQSMLNLYALGADVAEGILVEPEFGNRGGDFSSAKILRRDSRMFIARLHARLDPDVFADELYKAWLLWGCGILVENNPGGSGNVVIRALKDKPGINLLRTVTLDRVHDKRKSEYGWDTNAESKRQMIDELNEQIREGRFVDPSKNFWYECSTYIRDEKGRTNAQSRKYDDEVVASAICLQADKLMPMIFRPISEEVKRYSRDADVSCNWKGKKTQQSVMEETYAEF